MQIDLETGEILEDGTEEELAEWVQLYRATRDRWTPCEPHDETCPFQGQGAPPQPDRTDGCVVLRSAHSAARHPSRSLPEGGGHERSMP